MLILQKLHFGQMFVIFGRNISQISSEYHPRDARYALKSDQGPSETKKVYFILCFSVESGATERFAAEW